MADVRGASGVPGTAQFGGISTPTPSTPLYVDLATGDLYVLINNVVTLVGAIPGGSSYIIGTQALSKHINITPDLGDANTQLANRSFGQRDSTPYAILGDASDVIATRSFSPHPLPTMWG